LKPVSQSGVLSPEIHELIGLIYDAVTDQEGFFPFLRRFVEVFRGHSAAFSIYNLKNNSLVGAWAVNIPDEALAFYSEHVSHRDVLVETATQVRRDGEFCFVASNLDLGRDGDRLRKETRAGEWLASYGASEAAGAVAYLDGSYLNFFGIQRNEQQPAFTRAELRVFDQFLPHINRAVGLYTRLSHQYFQPAAERLALEKVNRGILVCDAAFRIVFSNAIAESILARGVGLSLDGNCTLIARGTGRARQLSFLLAKAVEDSISQRDGPDRVLQIQYGEHRLTLVITPLLRDGGDGSGGTGALMTLHDWNARPEVNPVLLRDIFDLTEAESRVALQLLEGLSLKEIAERSGRSRETTKYHLNSLFRKTGTSRQGALICLLSRCTLP
jgi:DNA-binding CsgD family transcriptional regulator/PAS domain-containing protein